LIRQAGPKSQFGGLKAGLASSLYQPAMAETVKIEPITPASWETKMAMINLNTFFLCIKFMIYFYN